MKNAQGARDSTKREFKKGDLGRERVRGDRRCRAPAAVEVHLLSGELKEIAPGAALWPNLLLYDPMFANDIRMDAIPTDLQSVLALSENMGPLSLYQFEAHTSYLHARYGRADRAVPVLGSSGLFAQIGCGVKESDTPKARATIRHWHGIVRSLWPGCPNELVRDDTILMVRGGYAIKHGRLPAPREFGVRPLDELSLERMRETPQRPTVERERVLPQEVQPALTAW